MGTSGYVYKLHEAYWILSNTPGPLGALYVLVSVTRAHGIGKKKRGAEIYGRDILHFRWTTSQLYTAQVALHCDLVQSA